MSRSRTVSKKALSAMVVSAIFEILQGQHRSSCACKLRPEMPPALPFDPAQDNQLLLQYTKLGGEAAISERGISGFNSGMPEFGSSLSDDEIWNILAFIRSTWSERIQSNQSLRNRPFH